MIEDAAPAEDLVWFTGPFEYGLAVLLAAVLAGALSAFVPFAPASFAFVFVGPLLIAGYGVLGLTRPRQVSLEADRMVIRPVLGRTRHVERDRIIEVREIVSPPLGSLIVRVRDEKGRTRGVTVQNRLFDAGLGVREHGREVGMRSSAQLTLLKSWVGDDADRSRNGGASGSST